MINEPPKEALAAIPSPEETKNIPRLMLRIHMRITCELMDFYVTGFGGEILHGFSDRSSAVSFGNINISYLQGLNGAIVGAKRDPDWAPVSAYQVEPIRKWACSFGLMDKNDWSDEDKTPLCRECLDCEREEHAAFYAVGRIFRPGLTFDEKGDPYGYFICKDHLTMLESDGAKLQTWQLGHNASEANNG